MRSFPRLMELVRRSCILFAKAEGTTIREKFENAFKQANKKQYYSFRNLIPEASVFVVFIKENIAHFAYVGDCRALLINQAKVRVATCQHDVDNLAERTRITLLMPHDPVTRKINQQLFAPYDNQSLKDRFYIDGVYFKTSRSIGCDNDYVICTPEYHKYDLTEQDEGIFIASSCFWESFFSKSVNHDQKLVEELKNADHGTIKNLNQKYYRMDCKQAIMFINLKKNFYYAWAKLRRIALIGSGCIAIFILAVLAKQWIIDTPNQ